MFDLSMSVGEFILRATVVYLALFVRQIYRQEACRRAEPIRSRGAPHH